MVLQCSVEGEITSYLNLNPCLLEDFTFLLWLLANFVLDDLALELPDWHVGDHIFELLRRPTRDLFRLAILTMPEEMECR